MQALLFYKTGIAQRFAIHTSKLSNDTFVCCGQASDGFLLGHAQFAYLQGNFLSLSPFDDPVDGHFGCANGESESNRGLGCAIKYKVI